MAEGKVCEREQAGCKEEKLKGMCAFHQAKQSISARILSDIFFKMGCVTLWLNKTFTQRQLGHQKALNGKRCVRLIDYLYIQVLNELFICNQLIFNATKFYLMKTQSLQQRVDSITTLSSQNKVFLTAFGNPCKLLTSGVSLQQGMKQSLMETNLLKGVNESPNCWSMQDLLKHNALPEGSFSARIVINISNKPELLLLGVEERKTLMVYLIKP